MKKHRVFSAIALTIALLIGYNNCSHQVAFRDASNLFQAKDIIVGNPMASKTLLSNICTIVTGCHPELSMQACEAGVLKTTGIDFQLGVPKGSVQNFSDIVQAETTQALKANVTAMNTCSSAIQGLSCSDASVQKAYNAAVSDPFAGVSFMLPTLPGACPAIFNQPPARAEYFVSPSGNDLNDGSADKPWATINHAAEALVPGVEGAIVHVASGNYYPPTTASCVVTQGYPNSCGIKTTRAGTATAPITFISDQMWGAKIIPADAYSAWYNSGDYVRIIGFEVIGNKDTNVGIQSDGSNVRVESTRVHEIPVTTGCARSIGGAAILHSNALSHDNESIGNLVYNIGPQLANGLPSGSYCNHAHGIYHQQARGNIQNNIIHHVNTWAITGWYNSSYLNITNNLLFSNGHRDASGSLVGGGMTISASTTTNDYTTVSNNILRNNSGEGIDDRFGGGAHNLYANNLLYANGLDFNLQPGTVPTGTLTTDPLMVNFRADGSGDYHLQAGSPAINTGIGACATAVPCTPDKDYVGFARPYGAGLDIGPYEWHP
jgi:hypothetical protein